MEGWRHKLDRVAGWILLVVGLACIGLGAAFWHAGSGRDIGGVVGILGLMGGLYLAVESFPYLIGHKR